MSKNKLFPLSPSGGEVEITLKVRAQDKIYKLVHIFREPTAADKKVFYGCMSRAELTGTSGTEGGTGYWGAIETLYDRCILRVEGYNLQDPGDRGESWKEAIPIEHKYWAVEELLRQEGTLAEETAKN